MNETEINDLMDTMVSAIRQNGATTATPANAGGDAQPPKASSEPEPDYREMFDPHSEKYNPIEAVKKITERNYGPLVADVARTASEGLYEQFRNRFPDFKDYEKDVRQVLSSGGVHAPNQQQLYQVFSSVKGHRANLKEVQSREAARTAPPSPPRDTTQPKVVELDEVEKVVARRMFPEVADPEAEYRKYADRLESGTTTMKVPLSGGARR